MNEGRKAIAMEGRDPIDGQHKANLYFGGGGKNNCSSTVHTLTARMPDGSGSSILRQSVQKCLTFCVALPPWDYGNVRGRSMIVAAAASETPTHSTEPIKKGRARQGSGREGRESEIITMTCENSLCLSYSYLICFDPLGFEIMFA